MTSIRTLIVMICMASLLGIAFAQGAPTAQTATAQTATAPAAPSAQTAASATPPPRIAPAEAKNHTRETATVCGKVVDTKVPKYGLAGHGKPITFDIDQPEPNPIFGFVVFGDGPTGVQDVIAAYKDKQVCVTGKINMRPNEAPFILALDRSQIKPQASNK